MANVNFGTPVSGIAAVVPGASQAERNAAYQRELIARQLEEQQRVAEQQRQYLEAQKAKQKPGFATRVAQGLVVGAAANVVIENADNFIAQNQEQIDAFRELIEQAARANAIETPVANSFAASTSTRQSNTPFQDPNFDASRTSFTNAGARTASTQLSDAARNQEMLKAVFEAYQVDENVRNIINNHLDTAREINQQLFPTDVSAQRDRTFQQTRTTTEQAHLGQQALEVRLALHDNIESSAIKTGIDQSRAQVIAAEVTAVFLKEQAHRDAILLETKLEQERQQAERLTAQSKLETALQAAKQREEQGLESIQKAHGQNIDPNVATSLDRQRALNEQQLQADPSNNSKGPTVDKDGNYVDPHRKAQKDLEIDAQVGKFELDYHEVNASIDGIPTHDHDQKDVGAAKSRGYGHSRDSRPVPGDDKSPAIVPPSVQTVDQGGGHYRAIGIEPPVRQIGPAGNPDI